ncbi:MAG: hypothetical protein ACYCW6_10840, partial [Candidatus Xenobia bacterium]
MPPPQDVAVDEYYPLPQGGLLLVGPQLRMTWSGPAGWSTLIDLGSVYRSSGPPENLLTYDNPASAVLWNGEAHRVAGLTSSSVAAWATPRRLAVLDAGHQLHLWNLTSRDTAQITDLPVSGQPLRVFPGPGDHFLALGFQNHALTWLEVDG